MKTRSAWIRGAGAFVLFGGVGMVFLFGAGLLGLGGQTTARHWLAAAQGPWTLPMVVACFAALAFLGVPQFILIAAAVAAYGPWAGSVYSWVGTLFSALVGFGLSRAWGGRPGSGTPGEMVSSLMGMVARNGFLASLVIRLVPFAPFVVVNMAAGLTTIGLLDFAAGTAIGIVPKIVLTAMAGHTFGSLLAGGRWGLPVTLLVLAGTAWIAGSLLARRWMKR